MDQYSEIIEINGKKLTSKFIEGLSYEEREELVVPIFDHFRKVGFLIPSEDDEDLRKEYQRLIDLEVDPEQMDWFNNSSLGTNICKQFCHKSFFGSRGSKKEKTMEELFNDDAKMLKTIRNRLGMDWLISDRKGPGVNEAFNFSFKMLIQGFRSQRLISPISMFKPNVAKFMALRYSKEGETVGDMSCGFGGRMLGTMAAKRKYVGTDPLTVPELQKMADFYGFEHVKLIKDGSENYRGAENSIDLYWSSPPYFDQEIYSNDENQAYSKGKEYFFDVYLKRTLENVRFMLKPGKWFGLNIKNVPGAIELAKEHFGDVVEEVRLRTVRSHLNKSAGTTKFESIFMFKNGKI